MDEWTRESRRSVKSHTLERRRALSSKLFVREGTLLDNINSVQSTGTAIFRDPSSSSEKVFRGSPDTVILFWSNDSQILRFSIIDTQMDNFFALAF